jgi:hypothetical protein
MSSIPEPIAVEARAKIIWGEPPAKVFVYLQEKGVGDKDAQTLLAELLRERASTIRHDGMKKIWVGSLLLALPIGYYFIALAMGVIYLKLFAGLLVAGAFGLWRLSTGVSMVLKPGSTTGDLSDSVS